LRGLASIKMSHEKATVAWKTVVNFADNVVVTIKNKYVHVCINHRGKQQVDRRFCKA